MANNTMQVGAAHADNDNDFAGDGSSFSGYYWGAQLEVADYPSSYIPVPSTSDITRNKDELTYKGDDGSVGATSRGTINFKTLIEDYDNSTSNYIVSLSDGGASSDRIIAQVYLTGDVFRYFSAASGGDSGSVIGTTDVSNGSIHEGRITWETDSANLFVNGSAEGSEDTAVDIPNDLDEIAIGSDQAGASQLNGVVSGIMVYRKPIKQ